MINPFLKGYVLCVVFVMALGGAGDSAAPAASDEVGGKDWDLPEAYLRDNGYRSEVVLNGFWAARVQGESGGFVKTRVPDGFPGFGDESAPPETREYYREFLLPKEWESRRLVLEMGGFTQDGQVTLDGKPIAQVPKGARFLEMDLPVSGKRGTTYRLGVTTGSITGDVWLRSFPKAREVIEDSFLTTSYRKREVRVRLAGAAPGGIQLQVTVSTRGADLQISG